MGGRKYVPATGNEASAESKRTMFKKLLAFLAALVCFASLAKAEDVPDSMRFRFIEHQGIQ